MSMNQIVLAYPENGREIRTIYEEGEVFFCLYDITKTLAEQNVKLADGGKGDSLTGLLKAQVLTLESDEIRSFDGESYVTEPGLFRIILRDNSKACKQFQRWVLHEVLPSIQKYGTYPAPLDGGGSDVKKIVQALLLEIEQRELLAKETKMKLAQHEKRMDLIDEKLDSIADMSESEYISVEQYCESNEIDRSYVPMIFGWSDKLKIEHHRDSKKKIYKGSSVTCFPSDIVSAAALIALDQIKNR